jgi:hypothetical protein
MFHLWLPINILCGAKCGCKYTLVFYSLFEYMNKFVDFVVSIGFPTPCLSICSRLQEFLVPIPVVDTLMFLPHSVTPHV